jgi:uncharacterized phage infection (PIP) family protein YhgE
MADGNEVNIAIRADASGATHAINTVSAGFSGLADTARQAGDAAAQVGDELQDAATSAADVGSAADDAASGLNDFASASDDAKQSTSEAAMSEADFKSALLEATREIRDGISALNDYKEKQRQVSSEMSTTATSVKESTSLFGGLKQSAREAFQPFDDLVFVAGRFTKAWLILQGVMAADEFFERWMDKWTGAAKHAEESVDRIRSARDSLTKYVEERARAESEGRTSARMTQVDEALPAADDIGKVYDARKLVTSEGQRLEAERKEWEAKRAAALADASTAQSKGDYATVNAKVADVREYDRMIEAVDKGLTQVTDKLKEVDAAMRTSVTRGKPDVALEGDAARQQGQGVDRWAWGKAHGMTGKELEDFAFPNGDPTKPKPKAAPSLPSEEEIDSDTYQDMIKRRELLKGPTPTVPEPVPLAAAPAAPADSAAATSPALDAAAAVKTAADQQATDTARLADILQRAADTSSSNMDRLLVVAEDMASQYRTLAGRIDSVEVAVGRNDAKLAALRA